MHRFFPVCILWAMPLALNAQAQGSDTTLQALLAEVRQLRLALQQSAVLAPRIQVTLQRIQLQQDQVSRLSRQLEDFHTQMSHASSESADLAAELKEMELRAPQEQDPIRRRAMEEQLKDTRTRHDQTVARQKVQEAQNQQSEMEISGRLHAEQGKLDELNQRLDSLERMLDPSQPKQP